MVKNITISNFSLEQWYYIFSIIGVFVTISAVLVAIWIPKRIAKKQNLIQLFDKRYDLFKYVHIFNSFRLDIFYYAQTHSTIPNSGDIKNFLLKNIKKRFPVENDFEILLNLNDLLFAYKNELILLFSNIDVSAVIKDIEWLIEILQDSYDEQEFNFEDIKDAKLIEWCNKDVVKSYNDLNEKMKEQMSIKY